MWLRNCLELQLREWISGFGIPDFLLSEPGSWGVLPALPVISYFIFVYLIFSIRLKIILQ